MLLVKPLQSDINIRHWIMDLTDEQLVEEIIQNLGFFVKINGYWYTKTSAYSKTNRAYAASGFTNISSEIDAATGLPLMFKIPNIMSKIMTYWRVSTDVASNAAMLWYHMGCGEDLSLYLSIALFMDTRHSLELVLFTLLKKQQEEKAWPISP